MYLGCEARVFREITYAVISGASYLVITKIVQKLQINRDPSQRDLIERGAEFIGHVCRQACSTKNLLQSA